MDFVLAVGDAWERYGDIVIFIAGSVIIYYGAQPRMEPQTARRR